MFIYDANLFVTCYIDDEWKLKVSEDNGNSWVIKDLMPEVSYVNSVAMTTYGLFASQGNANKLWKSVDMGDSWMEISSPIEHPHNLRVFDDHLYVQNGKQLWVGDANGQNWIDISPPLEGVFDGINEFTVRGQDIVVVCEARIFYSGDYGIAWEEIEITSSNSANKLAVTNDAIYVFSHELYMSIDNGATWNIILSYEEFPNLTDLEGFGNILVASTWNKGLIRLDEGTGKFVESHEGFTKGALYDLAYADGEIWVAAGKGIYIYYPEEYMWGPKMDLPVPEDGSEYEYIDVNNEGWVVTNEASQNYFHILKDHGSDWDTIHPDIQSASGILRINSVQLLDTTIFIFVEEFFFPFTSLYASNDGGFTWNVVKQELYQHRMPEFNGMHYLATFDSIYQSPDNGVTWTSLNNPRKIVMLHPTQDYLFGVSLNDSLYRMDASGSWINVLGNLDPNEEGYITFQDSYWDTYFFQDEDKVYAFWNYNLYVSEDGLNSWQLLQEDISGNAYLHLDDEIFYGYNGLYRTGIDELTSSIKDISNEEIDHRHLLVYPNPAQETVTVESLFENSAPGLLQVFSISGECISTERSTVLNSPIRINVSSFPEGIYIFRLTSKIGVETGKCIVHRK
jgi:photosystem II stability/assembly factor-like uncharacterized protein